MNADERSSGQQGYGQQSPQEDQSRTAQRGEQSPTSSERESDGGSPATGQASYGNSGDTGELSSGDTGELSQQRSDFGQEADLGGDGSQNSPLFGGSADDTAGHAEQGSADRSEELDGSQGTTDIEIERSQGRENDIEGRSL
jgi:hypothetical protein